MTLRVKKIAEIDELNTYLRGGIIGGVDVRRGFSGNINGTTLVFNAPAGTVTFATTPMGSQVGLKIKDIIDQINAVHAGYAHSDSQGRLVIEDPNGVVGVVLDATSTAARLFGFSVTGQVGTVINPPGGASPSLVSLSHGSLAEGTYLLVTDE